MATQQKQRRRTTLLGQLRWFIQLRWVAGGAVIVGSILDWQVLHWHVLSPWMALVGGVILLYNLLLWAVLPPVATRRTLLLALSWLQILLDLTCLMLLVQWTGGVSSPLLGFFVFHMVFASLLLSRLMAYTGAGVAMVLVLSGLSLSGQWQGQREQWLLLCGWSMTLLITVFLANRITRALRRQRRRLRKMTRQLRHQQRAMIQHEKMVALGQMAAGVAHEIANPLASMDSLLQLTQRNPQRLRPELVVTLRDQVARIHQIIQMMKSFSHPVEAQMQLLPLNEVVQQAIEMVQFDPRLKQIEIDRQFSAEVGSVRLLAQSVQQILVNLMINSLDAMAQAPHPKLTIRTGRREGWCEIEVVDNGSGIEPEHRKRLFEPFFTTKPVGKGTGLGLAISYNLVQRHGGKIVVRSQVGQGTSMTVRLPALPPAG